MVYHTGRYAEALLSLPDDVIDTLWYIIDNFLKDVFPSII